MKKPEKKNPLPSMYFYTEVIAYIEDKYNIKTRDYANKYGKNGNGDNEYLDFWHWVIEQCDLIQNRSYNCIYLDELIGDTPDWVSEILQYIKDEGFVDEEGDFQFWIEW